MSAPEQSAANDTIELCLRQDVGEVQEEILTDYPSIVNQHAEHEQDLVIAQLENERQLVPSEDDNEMQMAIAGNAQNPQYNVSGQLIAGDQIQHITVQAPQTVTHQTVTHQNVIHVQQKVFIQQLSSSQQLHALSSTSVQQPSFPAIQFKEVLQSEPNIDVVETVAKTPFQQLERIPKELEQLGEANVRRQAMDHNGNENVMREQVVNPSVNEAVHQEQQQCNIIHAPASQLKECLKQHYDEVELTDSTDNSTPVPLQITGYDGHERELFGKGGLVKAIRSRIEALEVLTGEPSRTPSQHTTSHAAAADAFQTDSSVRNLDHDVQTALSHSYRNLLQNKLCFDLVNQHGLGNIAPGVYKVKELFPMSAQAAAIHADKTNMSATQKTAYVRREGNKAAVVGPAGIGKTTFGKQMVAGIFGDECSNLPFVFYVPFKTFDFTEKISVLECLVSPSLSDWNYDPETDKALLDEINKSDDVYVITEALDEIEVSMFFEEAPKMSLKDRKTADVILKNLFSGHLLPRAKKLITSRPGAFLKLHSKYKPSFVVKVLGLSEKSQKLLCQQLCSDNKAYELIEQKLHTNQNLSALCYNPMYCKMMVRHLLRNTEKQLGVVSLTDVFASTFNDCVRSEHYEGEPNDLCQLTALALNGMTQNKFIFDQSDLGSLPKKCLETFLNLGIFGKKNIRLKIFDGDKRFFFVHLLWQEFFSALRIMFFLSVDEFNSLFPSWSNDRWDSVVKFMFGFLNTSVYAKISDLFPFSSKEHFITKANKLKSLLPSSLPNEWSSGSFPLKVCGWALESNDLSITSQVASTLPPNITLSYFILPIDISYLCYVLRTDQITSRVINIGDDPLLPVTSVGDHGNGLSMLLDAVNSSSHKIEKVYVGHTRIGEDEANGISKQINNIDVIGFVQCNLTSDVIEILSDAIQRRTTPLEELNLSSNNLGSVGLNHLSQCVGKVQKLKLDRCKISGDDLKNVAIRISERVEPLEELNLSGNNLGSVGLNHLSQCVGKVQKLKLDVCKISGDDLKNVAIRISERVEPLEELNLSFNNLGSVGLNHLSQCVGKVQKLKLDRCKISGDDLKIVAIRISERVEPLEELNLSGNNLGSVGLNHLSQCVGNVQKLRLDRCVISGADIENLAIKISERDEPMEYLDLGFIFIHDEGAEALCKCLHKIKKLNLTSNTITEVGMQAIRSVLGRDDVDCEVSGLDDQWNPGAPFFYRPFTDRPNAWK